MKRTYLCLLGAILLLSGCAGGTQAAEQTEEPEQTEQVIPTEEPEAAPEGLTMELEHEVYDPSLTSYTYLLHNNTSETVEFGEPYTIERNDGGQWAELTRRDDVGWNTVGYLLEPGQTMALTCGFWLYEETPTAGEYRLLAESRFLRAQVVYVSYFALDAAYKEGGTLLARLESSGTLDPDAVRQVRSGVTVSRLN